MSDTGEDLESEGVGLREFLLHGIESYAAFEDEAKADHSLSDDQRLVEITSIRVSRGLFQALFDMLDQYPELIYEEKNHILMHSVACGAGRILATFNMALDSEANLMKTASMMYEDSIRQFNPELYQRILSRTFADMLKRGSKQKN